MGLYNLCYCKRMTFIVFVKYTPKDSYNANGIFNQIDICGHFRSVRHQHPLLYSSGRAVSVELVGVLFGGNSVKYVHLEGNVHTINE